MPKQPYDAPWKRLYDTARWKSLRARYIKSHPHCECPHHKGKRVPATVVDHIIPHKGDRRLFFSYKNLQAMTKECHDRFKQSQEKGGYGFDRGCDESGEPLNPQHPWYEE